MRALKRDYGLVGKFTDFSLVIGSRIRSFGIAAATMVWLLSHAIPAKPETPVRTDEWLLRLELL